MKEKILIAEDENELAKAIKIILEYNNYAVTVTNAYCRAAEMLQKSIVVPVTITESVCIKIK